jgi:hypothetical protein
MRAAALGLLAVFGCTSDPDGPVVTGHGSVTVHVTANHHDVPDARVVLSGPAGNILGTAMTDGAGTARGELDTPGMVTVIDPERPTRLYTVSNVGTDETIEIGLDQFPSSEPVSGMITIAAPPNAPPAGTDHYDITTPCETTSATTLPATVAIHTGCAAADLPVIVTAQEPMGSLEYPGHGLAYVAGRTDASGTLAPGAWSTTCAQINVLTNPVMSLNFYPRFGGDVFRYAAADFCTLATPPAGYSAYGLLDFGEGAAAQAFTYVSGSLRMAMLDRDYAAMPATVEVQESSDLLVGDIALTRFDAQGVAWASDPALAHTDLVRAKLNWLLGGNQYIEWTLVVPSYGYALLPELPEPWALGEATSRTAELHFLAADWTNDRAVLHGQLAAIDGHRVPPGATLLDYTEQFYPDASP